VAGNILFEVLALGSSFPFGFGYGTADILLDALTWLATDFSTAMSAPPYDFGAGFVTNRVFAEVTEEENY
jgi:hypothetical protein